MFSFNTARGGGGGERADYLVWEPDRGQRVHTIIRPFVLLPVCLSILKPKNYNVKIVISEVYARL